MNVAGKHSLKYIKHFCKISLVILCYYLGLAQQEDKDPSFSPDNE